MTATRRRGRPKKEGEEERKVKVKGNNVKVKRKWLKRRRPRKPLEDEEELKSKKQKTFEKPSDQPEDEDIPQLFEANHHHAAQEMEVSLPEGISLSSSIAMAASGMASAVAASGMASAAEQQDMASELAASSSANDVGLPTSGRTSFSGDQDMTSSEVAASQAAPNGVLSNEGPENAVSSTLDIVAPLPHQVPSEAPRSPGGVSQVSMNSRAGQHRPNLLWQSVFCPICGCEYGQFKYDPCPGSRDPPTWTYRVADEEGASFFLHLHLVIEWLFDFSWQVDGLTLANFENEPMPPRSMRKKSKIGF